MTIKGDLARLTVKDFFRRIRVVRVSPELPSWWKLDGFNALEATTADGSPDYFVR